MNGAMVAGEIHTRVRHPRGQSRDKVERFEHYMRRAISVRRFQSIVDETFGRQRQALGAYRRPGNVTAQAFRLVALIIGGNHARVS